MELSAKVHEIKEALHELGRLLQGGDDTKILLWVLPSGLACAHRPLRHHPLYGGSGKDLPVEAREFVRAWVGRIKSEGIKSVICLLSEKELLHYAKLNLDGKNLFAYYKAKGLTVEHIPWDDPNRSHEARLAYKETLKALPEKALRVYNELPKPVLLHCSAGIDRTAPVAAFIWDAHKGTKSSYC